MRVWTKAATGVTLATLVACGGGGSAVRPQAQVRRVIMASAAGGFTPRDVGAFLDANFVPVVGGEHAVENCGVETIDEVQQTRDFLRIASADELRANVRAWGWAGSAGAEFRSSSYDEYGVYRVVHGHQRLRLDRGCTVDAAPEGARYFVSELVLGWSYEIAFHRTRGSSAGEVSFSFPEVLEAGLSTWAANSSLTWHEQTRGLARVGAEADPAGSSAVSPVRYDPQGPAAVVLVGYSPVPRALRAPADGDAYRIRLRALAFAATDENRASWDPGGLPDGQVALAQDGVTLLVADGRNDQLASRWEPGVDVPIAVAIRERSPLVVRVWDRDVFADDFAGSVEITSASLASACETWPLPEDGSDCTFQSVEGTTVTLWMRAAP